MANGDGMFEGHAGAGSPAFLVDGEAGCGYVVRTNGEGYELFHVDMADCSPSKTDFISHQPGTSCRPHALEYRLTREDRAATGLSGIGYTDHHPAGSG